MVELSVFLSDTKIKAVTIFLLFSTALLLVPYFQKRIASRLTAVRRETFNALSRRVNLQVGGLFLTVLVYTIIALIRKDMSFMSGDVLPFIIFCGALAAMGNIWLAKIELNKVNNKQKISPRKKLQKKIDDVDNKSLQVMTVAMFTGFYGGIMLLFILLAPNGVPVWLWFVNFLMTLPAIYSVSWSVAVIGVAEEYARK